MQLDRVQAGRNNIAIALGTCPRKGVRIEVRSQFYRITDRGGSSAMRSKDQRLAVSTSRVQRMLQFAAAKTEFTLGSVQW